MQEFDHTHCASGVCHVCAFNAFYIHFYTHPVVCMCRAQSGCAHKPGRGV